MKNIVKPLAALSAAVLLGCTTGCADTSWSVKTDGYTLSNGMYIYYTYVAYNNASSELAELYPDDDIADIFAYEIDGVSVDEWIKKEALDECIAQLTMEKLIDDKNIEINEDDLQIYEDYAQQLYDYYYSTYYEALGISNDSYIAATGTYSGYSTQLFDALYGEGGEFEVTEEERETYFLENYTYYYYMYYDLTTEDDDGNTVSLDEDDIDTVTSNFEKYANMINNAEKTIDDIETEYESDFEEDSVPSVSGTAVLEDTSLDEDILSALDELEEGEATTLLLEDDTIIYFVYKGVIEDQLDTLEDETTLSSLLHTMKDEEYEEYLDEQEAALEYETNEACLSKYTVQRIINITNKLYS